MWRIYAFVFGVLMTLAPTPVLAANYFGKIQIVQVTSAGLRFYAGAGAALSLYASGDHRDVLLQAFFRKATMNVVITCPAGITGTCGEVVFVSVHNANF